MLRTRRRCTTLLHVAALIVAIVVAFLTTAASASSAPRRLASPSSSRSSKDSVNQLKCEDEGKPAASHLFGRSAPPPQKSCSSVGVVLANERARFSFDVAEGRTVACELNAMSGDADLEVSPPAHNGGPGPKSSREAFGIDRVAFTAAEASSAGPGTYVAEVFGFADETSFELRCAVGSAPAKTANGDLKALTAVVDQCCSHSSSSSSSSSCPALRAALKDADDGGPGPCGVPPNECDSRGHLTTLSLAGDGLRCSFPTAVADLGGSLRELDVSLNDLDGDFGAHVQPVLSKLPKLEAAAMALNRIRGQLSCELVGASSESDVKNDDDKNDDDKKKHRSSSSSSSPSLSSRLARFTATHNRLSGPIPECLLDPKKSPIQELSLSANELSGRLPRSVGDERDIERDERAFEENAENKEPSSSSSSTAASATAYSPLRVLSLGDQAGGGFEGEIPCLSCAPGLEIVQLQGNSLEGALPRTLPPRLKELRLAGNALTGGIPRWKPDSLALLEVISLDGNRFGGGGDGDTGNGDGNDGEKAPATIPPSLSGAPSLRSLSAAGSGLGGDLPRDEWGPSLERVLLGNNSFTGEVPAALARVPGLELLDLSGNRLSGELSAFADALEGAQGARRSALRYLNLASNDLEGRVPQGIAAAGALAPGAWGAVPVFSGGARGGGDGGSSSRRGRAPSAGSGVVVLGKTLNLTDNRLSGPLPGFLVRAMAESKDVAVGLGGDRNEFDCPRDGKKIGVSRAMPSSATEGVTCLVRGGRGGERKALGEVIEVVRGGRGGDDDGEDRRSKRTNNDNNNNNDDDDDDDDNAKSPEKRSSGFAPKAAEAKSGLSRPGSGDGGDYESPRGDGSRDHHRHGDRGERRGHNHRRSLAAAVGVAVAHVVAWCSAAAVAAVAWKNRNELREGAAALSSRASEALPPSLGSLLSRRFANGVGGGGGGNDFFSGYSGLGGGGGGGAAAFDDTLEMIDVDFAADAFQPDARAFSEKDSLLGGGAGIIEVKARAGGEESSSSTSAAPSAAAASQQQQPPSSSSSSNDSRSNPSETIGAYRPPQPPAGYQD